MQFIDISVPAFSGHFTQRAKRMGLQTKIIFKTPAWDLTTVRLLGERTAILMMLSEQFEDWIVAMHAPAIKAAEQADVNPVTWKNRGLMENRADS